ncbi:MAG: class I tRNA ligase family protein, partial [Candidatus Uhrbacteria bacterium]
MADPKLPKIEEQMLEFWKQKKIFEQSFEREASHGDFVFYEGPPTANAPPAIHHIEARAFKDVIPRYRTMCGWRVLRKAGWDTHGLPVELQIEKKLGLSTKRDVERYGIEKFNTECRDSVWEFKRDWEQSTERIGFWLDLRDPYVTYEMPFVESVWWFLKQCNEKGLLARSYKSVWYCPRCETPLSSHEVAQGYEDTEDPSVFIKFKIESSSVQSAQKVPTYFLAWTTTPWTLPGNAALAVHPDVEYAVVAHDGAQYVVAVPSIERVFGEGVQVLETKKGSELIGAVYEPLYPTVEDTRTEKIYSVLSADFVNLEDGTGIV